MCCLCLPLRFLIKNSTDLEDRKYLGSGFSSKMSDNEDPLPVLGYSVVLAVKHLPLQVIPQVIKRGNDRVKGASPVVAKESFNVFKDKMTGSFSVEYPAEFKKERTPCFVEETGALSSH